VKCAKCSSENPSTSKFCSACAAPLTLACPKCDHGNSLDAKYCGSCGSVLAARPAAEAVSAADSARAMIAVGERRQATVVFSDLTGYTALTERLDPEEVNEVLGLVKQAAGRIAERHGGTINQFVGDEVMMVFGIPNAEEDDPVRAIKAALELHAEIRDKTASLQDRTDRIISQHTRSASRG